jgi:DNA-directed RNA polymerase subunit N (RpoN/RPB10)
VKDISETELRACCPRSNAPLQCINCGEEHDYLRRVLTSVEGVNNDILRACCPKFKGPEYDPHKSIDIGIPEDKSNLLMINAECRGCGRRVGKYLRRFNRIRWSCASHEQAFKVIGINEECCRHTLITPKVVPANIKRYDPEVVQGTKSVATSVYEYDYGDTSSKYRGHMLKSDTPPYERVTEARPGVPINVNQLSLIEMSGLPPHEQFLQYTGKPIPNGYSFNLHKADGKRVVDPLPPYYSPTGGWYKIPTPAGMPELYAPKISKLYEKTRHKPLVDISMYK